MRAGDVLLATTARSQVGPGTCTMHSRLVHRLVLCSAQCKTPLLTLPCPRSHGTAEPCCSALGQHIQALAVSAASTVLACLHSTHLACTCWAPAAPCAAVLPAPALELAAGGDQLIPAACCPLPPPRPHLPALYPRCPACPACPAGQLRPWWSEQPAGAAAHRGGALCHGGCCHQEQHLLTVQHPPGAGAACLSWGQARQLASPGL